MLSNVTNNTRNEFCKISRKLYIILFYQVPGCFSAWVLCPWDYTPVRDQYTPVRDQYTPVRDHTNHCLDSTTRSSFCSTRDPIVLGTSAVRNWVAIRLKKCLLCVDKTKLNTNHPRGYVAIASLFHKTHVKNDKNDHVWGRITCGGITCGVRHLW